jgi:hypothetical protein
MSSLTLRAPVSSSVTLQASRSTPASPLPSRASVNDPGPDICVHPCPSVVKDSPSFSSRPSVTSSVTLHALRFTLAELPPPSPSSFGHWLISAFAALSVVVLAKQLGRKTPLEAEFLSRREFQEFKDKDFAELRHRVDNSFQSLSDKLDGINNRLHELRASVERMDERTKYLHAWESEIKPRVRNNEPLTTDN